MEDFGKITLGQYVQFKRPAPVTLTGEAIGGPVVGWGVLPSFPALGQLPKVLGCDGREHFAMAPSWLASTISNRTLRARRKASK